MNDANWNIVIEPLNNDYRPVYFSVGINFRSKSDAIAWIYSRDVKIEVMNSRYYIGIAPDGTKYRYDIMFMGY